MGAVYQARHHDGIEVAVKLLTAEGASDPGALLALQREVRAVASLAHPGVVRVLDYGRIEAGASAASNGQLVSGTPYLIMELAKSDLHHQRPDCWQDCHELLSKILEGLAHAHAHGLLHRDLKPSNILMFESPDAATRPALTDFGLAWVLDRPGRRFIAGTPAFMAPEAIAGDWRVLGPWTDLYSLGCLGFDLVCGAPPFGRGSMSSLFEAHSIAVVPDLRPLYPVPKGLQDWLATLLAKSPRSRFRFAADALHALSLLNHHHLCVAPAEPKLTGTPDQTAADTHHRPAPDTLITGTFGSSDGTWTTPWMEFTRSAQAISTWSNGVASTNTTWLWRRKPEPPPMVFPSEPLPRPPIPETWRARDTAASIRRKIVGVGLGLYGIRRVPFIGRERVRDRLWEALVDAATNGRPRVVALVGEAGSGKSRLTEWLSRRAQELGSAVATRAVYAEHSNHGDGLNGMLRNHLRTTQLPHDDIAMHVAQTLPEAVTAPDVDFEVLVDLLAPPRPARSQRRTRRRKRLQTIAGVLCASSTVRPLIVVLDDIHWSAEALGLVEVLLERRSNAPVLVVLTARGAQLSDASRYQLDRLDADGQLTVFRIDRLPKEAHKKLVEHALGLAPSSVDKVVERTSGNPLFAIQLVGDWVARGLLNISEDGFTLVGDDTPTIPDDIHLLWCSLVERCLDELEQPEPTHRMAVEVAAILGISFLDREWQQVCKILMVASQPALREALARRGLIVARDDMWSFSHGLLQESLERRAEERGSSETLHRACAAVLAANYGQRDSGVSERLARHYRMAQDHEMAVLPMLDAFVECQDQEHFTRCQTLIAELDELMLQLGLPVEDSRWGRLYLCQLQCRHLAMEYTDPDLEKAVLWAKTHNLREFEGSFRSLRASVAYKSGHLANARSEFEQALLMLPDATMARAETLRGLMSVLIKTNHTEQAQIVGHEAILLWKTLGIKTRLCATQVQLAMALRFRSPETSIELVQRALRYFKSTQQHVRYLRSLNALGDLHRFQGDILVAMRCYQEIVDSAADPRQGPAVDAIANLGLSRLAVGDPEAARTYFRRAEIAYAAKSWEGYVMVMRLGVLVCSAELGDWSEWEDDAEPLLQLLRSLGLFEVDLAWLFERALEASKAAGQPNWSRWAGAALEWQRAVLGEKVHSLQDRSVSS